MIRDNELNKIIDYLKSQNMINYANMLTQYTKEVKLLRDSHNEKNKLYNKALIDLENLNLENTRLTDEIYVLSSKINKTNSE